MRRGWLLIVLMIAASPAIACKSDVDCDVGSKCLLQAGQAQGVCTNTRKSGHADDGGMSRDPTDPSKANVSKCDVDLDCGPMGKCLRSPGKVVGSCAGGTGGIHIHN
jgi:hypothetical protein